MLKTWREVMEISVEKYLQVPKRPDKAAKDTKRKSTKQWSTFEY